MPKPTPRLSAMEREMTDASIGYQPAVKTRKVFTRGTISPMRISRKLPAGITAPRKKCVS